MFANVQKSMMENVTTNNGNIPNTQCTLQDKGTMVDNKLTNKGERFLNLQERADNGENTQTANYGNVSKWNKKKAPNFQFYLHWVLCFIHLGNSSLKLSNEIMASIIIVVITQNLSLCKT